MSKKKVQIPFSIEAWNKSNTRVETKCGRSARILCTDLNSEYPIVAAVRCNDGSEYTSAFDAEGHFCKGHSIDEDLVIIEEVEEPDRWEDNKHFVGRGWFINDDSNIYWENSELNNERNFRLFASEKLAKSALAMARISQLIAHDERYGGAITNEEWRDGNKAKYYIYRYGDDILIDYTFSIYRFLAFHESGQRDLFLAENEQLIKDFLMID